MYHRNTCCHRTTLALLLSLPLLSGLYTVHCGAEQNRETIIAQHLIDQVNDAQLVWLEADKESFLNLFNAAWDGEHTTALILLHGMGQHPDWPKLIQPLRLELAGVGLPVLSMQLPLLSPQRPAAAYSTTTPDIGKRLDAGYHWLRQRGHTRIFLVGHGFGALSALHALTRKQTPGGKFSGLVMLGIGEYPYLSPRIRQYRLLEKLRQPTLDIYFDPARHPTSERALQRRLAIRKGGNPVFQQIHIHTGDKSSTDMEKHLAGHIKAWLDGLPETTAETVREAAGD